MLQEPNVRVLAVQLQTAIDDVLADVESPSREPARKDSGMLSARPVPTIR
jgi:hypothetical protein